MKPSLKNKVAVVTDGGGVLCGAMAKELARQGMKVTVLSLTYENAHKTVNEIEHAGEEAVAVSCDVMQAKSVKEAKQMVLDAFGGCDLLINGAGGNHQQGTTTKEILERGDVENEKVRTFFDLTPEGFQFVFDLNMFGTFLTTPIFARHMHTGGIRYDQVVGSNKKGEKLRRLAAIYSLDSASLDRRRPIVV